MRKKFGRICALVVVGMFLAMTSMSVPADDPDDWTIGGDDFGGGTTQILGTLSTDDLWIVAGGNQGIILNAHVDPISVGIGLAPGILPRNTLDVGGRVAVGEHFAEAFFAPINGMIIEGQVGIGTTEPMVDLDVRGYMIVGPGTLMNARLTVHEADGAHAIIGKADTNGYGVLGISENGVGVRAVSLSGPLAFRSDGDARIDGNFTVIGKVGIGVLPVAIPMNNLDVAGNVAVGEGFAGMFFAPPNGMIVKGDVGIGTPTPQYKLDVEGYVQAYGYYTGDIIFQKDGQKHWRMFEDEDGLYLESFETSKVYEFVLHEKKK